MTGWVKPVGGFIWKVLILGLPSLVGDLADLGGNQGLVQKEPTNLCAPMPHITPYCRDCGPGEVLVWWSPAKEAVIEVYDPWTGSLDRIRAKEGRAIVAAEPQELIAIMTDDGDCLSRAYQVPWEPGPSPAASIHPRTPVTAPLGSPLSDPVLAVEDIPGAVSGHGGESAEMLRLAGLIRSIVRDEISRDRERVRPGPLGPSEGE